MSDDDFAFPTYTKGGLTKREYFAALAMQGMVTACGIQFGRVDHADLAGHALHLADALIAALNEPQP